MRFLIIQHFYQAYLENFHLLHPDYSQLSYRDAFRTLMDEAVDVADSYSVNLKKLGHEAEEIVINDEILQKQWAAENGVDISGMGSLPSSVNQTLKHMGRQFIKPTSVINRKIYSFLRKKYRRLAEPWMLKILVAQIKKIRPDVLVNHAIWELDEKFLTEVRPFVKLIIGQHASPLPTNMPYKSYDLMLSSLPNLVVFFHHMGLKSEYFRLGFNSTVLKHLKYVPHSPAVVHIGRYGLIHKERNEFLEKVAKQITVDFWGFDIGNLSKKSPILQNYHGEAWGITRSNILHNSLITLTKHISSVAGRYANNQTLYETTGAGTLLITDFKENICDLFEVDNEVVVYHNANECIELVKYYLDHKGKRDEIANAGQQRTLKEHTYYQRMQELINIVKCYL